MKKSFILIVVLLMMGSITACASAASPTSSATPTISPSPSATPTPTSTATYSMYQLAYRVLDKYPDYFWCDPDFYPLGRPGGEEANSLAQFSTIQANTAEFSAILERLNLPGKTDYSDAEKLSIYREHKKITLALQMTPQGSVYQFVIRTGQNQGFRITGLVTYGGSISETAKETSFNTCPICLTRGTLIDTPSGAIPVEQLQPRMIIWTQDSSGERKAAAILKTSSTPVPPSFQVVKITLTDGRTVTASAGHPSADLRALGDYQTGNFLDGSQVASVGHLVYLGGATYDVLPAGETGVYWANGVQLLSTLK
jgi:hypothetical protein